MSRGGVKVTGLRPLVKELRRLDDAGLTDELKDANVEVAELVVQRAKGNASTKMQRKAADTLRPSRTLSRAQVLGGNSSVPFFGGAEFGAGRGRTRTAPSGRRFEGYNQFEPWRGNGSTAGYFLYPAIRESEDEIVDIYGDAIDKITRRAFPEGAA